MRKYLLIASVMLSGWLITGCSEELFVRDIVQDAEEGADAFISFELSTEDGQTKSALVGDESRVETVYAVCYNSSNGQLVDYRKCHGTSGGLNIGSSLLSRSRYVDIYFLANVDGLQIPNRESEMRKLVYTLPAQPSENGYIPMAASVMRQYVSNGRGSVTRVSATLRRLMAKIEFELDKTALPYVDISSARLRNAAADIRPFASPSVPDACRDFDYASQADLAELNGGGKICFYTLENMQGNLLAGNTDPWKKVPENLGRRADFCTYLELEAQFKAGSGYSGSVIYRLYLGRNNTSNFDVERNHVYHLSLSLSESGLKKEAGWKIDVSGMMKDRVTDGVDSLYIGQKHLLGYSDMDVEEISLDRLSHSTRSSIAEISLEGGSRIAVKALGKGTDTIYVKGCSEDGIRETRTILLDVDAPMLYISDEDLYLNLDGRWKSASPSYIDRKGSVISDFDEELYQSLLKPGIRIDDVSSAVQYTVSGQTASSRLVSTASLEGLQEKFTLGRIRVSAPSEDITPLDAPLYTCDPFPLPIEKLATFESKSLIRNGADEEFTAVFGTIRDFTDNKTYRLDFERFTEEDDDKCTVSYSEGSIKMVWKYGSFADKVLPRSSEAFMGSVVNLVSGDIWTSPRRWRADFNVHAAIGAEVFFAGGLETSPMSYQVRARWYHSHDNASPLTSIQGNLVASMDSAYGFYATGVGTPLYMLTPATDYPKSAGDNEWYSKNSPRFYIVDIDSDNTVSPIKANTPYFISGGAYNYVIHYLSEVQPSSGGWIR